MTVSDPAPLAYARTPSLGTLLREFTGGHVRQLQAVQRRHLLALADRTGVLAGIDQRAFVDIDSLLRPVYGHVKQGASFGHSKIAGKQVLRKGLSRMVTAISTPTAAPVIAGIRLRAGRAGSGRGRAAWSPRPSTSPKPPVPRTSWSAAIRPTATRR